MKNSVNKTSKSDLRSKITRILQKNKSIRFTELRKELDVSKPVLSYHLNLLQEEESIEFIKKGREKHYQLSPNVGKQSERKTDIFFSNYEIFLAESVLKDFSNEDELFQEFGKTTNALMLFTLLKSIETGENWFKSINHTILEHALLSGLEEFLRYNKTDMKLTDIVSKMQTMGDFKKINSYVNDKKLENKIKKYYKILTKLYPEQMKAIDESIKECEKYQ